MNKNFIEGNWQGTLSIGMVKLGITFIIERQSVGNFTE